MTERELFEAIGRVDDDLILAADAPAKKRRRVVHLHWQQVVSVAACACIVLGGAAVWRSGTLHKSSIASEAAMAADVPEAAAETAPAPDMPMIPKMSPCSMCRLMSFKASTVWVLPLKVFVRWFSSMSAKMEALPSTCVWN